MNKCVLPHSAALNAQITYKFVVTCGATPSTASPRKRGSGRPGPWALLLQIKVGARRNARAAPRTGPSNAIGGGLPLGLALLADRRRIGTGGGGLLGLGRHEVRLGQPVEVEEQWAVADG